MMIRIDKERLLKEVIKKGTKKVVLQFPEGLKQNAQEIALFLEENGIDVIIDADPCFGACDLREGDYLLIHFGHAPVYRPKEPVLFFEVEDDFDFIPVLSQNLSRLPERVGILTTVQHRKQLPKIEEFLRKRGFTVRLGKGKGRVKYSGQILGCNFSSARIIEKEVDAFLFFGGGTFHPIGVALATHKPVFRCMEDFEEMNEEKERILKQRYGQIFQAGEALNWGVLVSRKKGQRRMKDALKMKRLLEGGGRHAFMVEMDFISEEKVSSMKLDAYVMCACPRIAVDDVALFRKPVLTPTEVEILLGKRKDYVLDEMA